MTRRRKAQKKGDYREKKASSITTPNFLRFPKCINLNTNFFFLGGNGELFPTSDLTQHTPLPGREIELPDLTARGFNKSPSLASGQGKPQWLI